MPIPKKVQRLVKATQSYDRFHRTLDLVTIALFFILALAVADKITPRKIIAYEWLKPSWAVIGAGFGLFLVMMSTQLSKISTRRPLSPFEQEAVLKAARFQKRRRRPLPRRR